MEKVVSIKDIIHSKAANDDSKGDLVFTTVKQMTENNNDVVILDFAGIELINTAFLNNAIGKMFDIRNYDISKNKVKVRNMQKTMLGLLQESISNANRQYNSGLKEKK